ncbi:MAG TPA: DUF3795 domain-containing protein [Anaerolineae bacterium]|nr:DUF3795 domain-containing protein [Anaerolineae bacterium]
MRGSEDLLAYCGFYCGDCLGYTGVVADAAQGLMDVLETYKFDRTAECVFPSQLREYDKFCEMLGFMTELRCSGICRQEGGVRPSSCEVKNCCIEKGFFACYECDDFETCDKFESLHKGLHTGACVKNMRAIREMGLEAWLAGGERHCYWDETDE